MDFLDHLIQVRGCFTRREAVQAGYDDKEIAAAVRQGRWRRFRRGYYAMSPTWDALDDVGRHRVRSAAVLHSLGDAVTLSHVSAAVAHGLDIWGIPLERVHVTRLDGGAGRLEGDVVHHEGVSLDDDLVTVNGVLATRPERAAIEAVAHSSGEVALALFDNLLHHRLCDEAALRRQFEAMARWPFTRHLHIPVRLADGRSASIGESRGRWFCWRMGLPLPQLQYDVFGRDGHLIGTCDWWWEDARLLGEFDGRVKYGRLLKPGQEPGDVVFAEKRREDQIREATGCRMIRLTWSDYDHPRRTRHRLATMLNLAG